MPFLWFKSIYYFFKIQCAKLLAMNYYKTKQSIVVFDSCLDNRCKFQEKGCIPQAKKDE